jgi:hypothetical protein
MNAPPRNDTLHYAPGPRISRRKRFVIAGAALSLLLATAGYFLLPGVGYFYADQRYAGLHGGMTKAQVDRHLHLFHSRKVAGLPGPYGVRVAPGESVVRYSLIGFGDDITVVFDASGLVRLVIPTYE